jgi:tRNA-intron endonuclease
LGGGLERGGLKAVLAEDYRCRVVEGDIEGMMARGYGDLSEGQLVLWPEEVLYLLEKKALSLTDREGNPLDFKAYLDQLSKEQPHLWPRYIVYRDLRSSGRIVKMGFGGMLTYRLYEPSNRETSKYLIFPFPEGSTLKMEELLKATKQVMRKGKILIIAVLERRGEVIYYSCTDTNLSNL